MKTDIIQTSFAAGEFGPSLYGRTDIVQYANACALVENMLPRSYGPAISMPGTRYVATVSDSTLNTRLIKFVFNRSDAYAIETGDLYMRFYTNRGQVVTPSGTEDLSAFAANLKAHWKLNDNAGTSTVIDTVGSFSGTLSTLTSSVSTTGIVNQAFNLNGMYYISVADDIQFTRTASTQPMTILAWIYHSNNTQNQYIFSKNDVSSQKEYELLTTYTDDLAFQVFDNSTGGVNRWTADTPLETGWNFIAMTFQGDGTLASDCNLYINGQITNVSFGAQFAGFVKMSNTTAQVEIGSHGIGLGKLANKIDNVAFLDIALTPAQVSTLYTSTPYQLTTVFREGEISDVHYAQLNDVVWLAHPNYPIQKLVRTSANEWSIANAPIIGGPFLDENTPAITSAGISSSTITITASATTGTINLTVTPTNASLFTLSTSTLGHQGAYWMIGGLAQTNSTTGLQELGYVRITNVVNSYTATATVIKNLKATTATNVWAEGAWSAVRGYPARITLQEMRLFLARTAFQPQNEWGSKVFEYENFSLDTQADDDGLNLPLASPESNEIQWLAGGKSLVAGTYGGAFVTNSGSSEPLTPNNAKASEEVGFGSESIMPKKIGNLLYFIQRFGQKLREMFFNWELETYKAVDRTILSPHILKTGVVDMDVQQNPETILYCVLENGTLATLTREADQDVTAWARHSTNGTYTSVAIIPSQSESYDEAWVIVERWINGAQKKYVEYFENIEVPDRQDLCLYLHSALTYNAYDATSMSSATISLSASSGSVTLTSSTGYFNGGMIGKRIRAINASGNTIGQGQITATASTTSITLSITTTFNALSYAPGFWGVSVASLSGLSHLEQKTVGVLADGQKESLTRSVASGVFTLGSNYWVISVGLSYDQILFTLPKEAGTNRGTAQGKLQRYNEVFFKLNRSTQDFKYGPDADHLSDVLMAFTPTSTSLYTGVLPPQGGGIAMPGGYFRGAQIYIKNSNPLPMEVLSIIGTLDTYEK